MTATAENFAFNPETVQVKVADKPVHAKHMNGTISFAIAISLGEGMGEYRVQLEP